MPTTVSNPQKWRAVLQDQSLTNARRWLSLINDSANPAALIAADYENLLRALENCLLVSRYFETAYQLIHAMHFTVIDYADWDRWLIYLEKALSISRINEREKETAELLVKIGEVQYRMGQLETALSSYQAGADIYQAQQAHASYARTIAKIAVLHDLKGNTQEGINLCLQALQIAENVGDSWGIAQIHLNLSHIYKRARNWEMSLLSSNKAYHIFQHLKKTKEANKALVNVVGTLADMGEWEVVNMMANSIKDQLEATSDVYTLSRLKNILGIVAFTRADYALAEFFWQEALLLHSQIQEPKELAGIYNNLGMVYTRLAEWETAAAMFVKAIDLYRRLGDSYNWANALDNLADLHVARKDTVAFQDALQQALQVLQTIQEMPHAQALINNIHRRLPG